MKLYVGTCLTFLTLGLVASSAAAEVDPSKLFGAERPRAEKVFDYGLGDPKPLEELARMAKSTLRVLTAAKPGREALQEAFDQGLSLHLPPEVETKIKVDAADLEPDQRERARSDGRWDWMLGASVRQLEASLRSATLNQEALKAMARQLHGNLSLARRAEQAITGDAHYKLVRPYLKQLFERADRITNSALAVNGKTFVVKDASKLVAAKRAWGHLVGEVGLDGVYPNASLQKAGLGMFAVVSEKLKTVKPRYSLKQMLFGTVVEPTPPRPRFEPAASGLPQLVAPLRESHASSTMWKVQNPRVFRKWMRWFRMRMHRIGLTAQPRSTAPRAAAAHR